MSLNLLLNYPVFSFSKIDEEIPKNRELPTLEKAIKYKADESFTKIVGITNSMQGVEFSFENDSEIESAFSIKNNPIYRITSDQRKSFNINKERITKVLIILGESLERYEEFKRIYCSIEEILEKYGFQKNTDINEFIEDEDQCCFCMMDFTENKNWNENNILNLIKETNDINYFGRSFYIGNKAIDVIVYIGDACQHGWHLQKGSSVFGIESLRTHFTNSLLTIPCIVDFSDNKYCKNASTHETLTPFKLVRHIDIHLSNLYNKAYSFIKKYNGVSFCSFYIGTICMIAPELSKPLYEKIIETLLNLKVYPSIESIAESIRDSKISLMEQISLSVSRIPSGVHPKISWNTIFALSHENIDITYSKIDLNKLKDQETTTGKQLTNINDILGYIEKSAPNQKIYPSEKTTGIARSFVLSSIDPEIKKTVFIYLLYNVSFSVTQFEKHIDQIKNFCLKIKKTHPDVNDFRFILRNGTSLWGHKFFKQIGIDCYTFNRILFTHSMDFKILNDSISLPKINVKPTIGAYGKDFSNEHLKAKYDKANSEFIEHFIKEPEKHVLVLLGEASYGKTHFLKQMCYQETAQFKIGQITRTLVFITPDECVANMSILDHSRALLNFIWKKLNDYNYNESDVEVLLREGVIIPVFDGLDEICTQCKIDAETIIRHFKGIMGQEEEQIYKVIFSSRTAYWKAFFENDRIDDTIIYKINGFSKDHINEYINKYIFDIDDLDIEKSKREVGNIINRLMTHGELSPLILEIVFDAYNEKQDGKDHGIFEFAQYDDEKGEVIEDPWLYLINIICDREISKMKRPMNLQQHLSYLGDLAKEFDKFNSDDITKCFEKFIDNENVSIHPAVLISHPFFESDYGASLKFRHPVIKNYLIFHSIRHEIAENFISPEPFFVKSYSKDDFFKELINKQIFEQQGIEHNEVIDLIQLLIQVERDNTLRSQVKNVNSILGFHLLESFFSFNKDTTDEQSTITLFKILKAEKNGIKHINFNYSISRTNFSNIKFEKCIFGKKFTFDHCQIGNVSFRDCFFESEFELVNCGKKDCMRMEHYESLEQNFKSSMKAKYDILFIDKDRFDDIKSYARRILSSFIFDNKFTKVKQRSLIYNNAIFNLIVDEITKEWKGRNRSSCMFHFPNEKEVLIKKEYRNDVKKFVEEGIMPSKINKYLTNVIRKLEQN